MPVSPELHEKVLRRDKCCFLFRLAVGEQVGMADPPPPHKCMNQWGQPHSAYDLSQLTVDHVHLHAGGTRGKRAPDDEQHLVAMCAKGNIDGPSRAVREAEREYLRSLYPNDA